MGYDVGRRTLITTGLAAAVAFTAAACSPSGPAGAGPTRTPTRTPSPTPTASAPGAGPATSARPETARSFGPNSTHYPEDLPWLGERAGTELVAECDWDDIAQKIAGLSPDDVAAGAVIRVKAGTLVGGGSGSSAPAVLANLGDTAWSRNVLIAPLEGFGSVSLATEGSRIDKCARLSLFGFVSAGGLTMTECSAIQVGWSRLSALSVTRGGRDLAFYELVLGFRQNPEDTVGIRPTDANEMVNISRYGCVFGPSVKPADSDAHCDTIQLEGTGSGPFGPFTSVDCVDYGSSNAAELLQDKVSAATYEHCLILGDQLPWRIFPLRPGDYEGAPNAFSGGCNDVQLTDTVVCGAIGRMGFTRIENSTLSYAPQASQQPRDSGTWRVDAAVANWTAEEIMAQQAIPDYEVPTLRDLWRW